LNARAFHLVVEQRILERRQIQPRRVFHNFRADVFAVTIRQHNFGVNDQSRQDAGNHSRQHKFQRYQPPKIAWQSGPEIPVIDDVVDDDSGYSQDRQRN
jgi:hypothetical protein